MCNCGKGATSRQGMSSSRAKAQDAVERAGRSTGGGDPFPAPAGPAPRQRNTPVRAVSQSFALDTTDGRTQTFGSKLEADAARVRAGGGRLRPAS